MCRVGQSEEEYMMCCPYDSSKLEHLIAVLVLTAHCEEVTGRLFASFHLACAKYVLQTMR
jgi:hypothetical protein